MLCRIIIHTVCSHLWSGMAYKIRELLIRYSQLDYELYKAHTRLISGEFVHIMILD